MALDADKVVQVALRLLNEEGIDCVTTRRLAQELGVQGPALYWHFKSKQELFDHMVAKMLEPPFPVSTDVDWAESLADAARRARRTMLSYRDGARLVAGSLPVDRHHTAVGLEFLQAAGFRADEALDTFLLLGRFVIGWTLAEQALQCREESPPPGFDREASFEFGLSAVISGLQSRLRERASTERMTAELGETV